MSHLRGGLARAMMVTILALAGAAVLTAPVAPRDPAPTAADLCQYDDSLEPAAICRLLPQCWTNADCDEFCGPGLGKCVHSKCPVRLCRCG